MKIANAATGPTSYAMGRAFNNTRSLILFLSGSCSKNFDHYYQRPSWLENALECWRKRKFQPLP